MLIRFKCISYHDPTVQNIFYFFTACINPGKIYIQFLVYFDQNLDRITGVQSMEIHFTIEFVSLSETKL